MRHIRSESLEKAFEAAEIKGVWHGERTKEQFSISRKAIKK